MLIGPVFGRELVVAPRRARLYVARTVYGLLMLFLISTAWLILTGTQLVRDLGDLARFGSLLFPILAQLQLALAVFFSALLSASAVAQEKDRRTLVLLLLTRLSNSELVLGKLLASLLNVLVLVAAAVPLFMLTALFGGVSFEQIARVFAVTFASIIVCGSLGSTVALWREKTFQALAMTVLVLVLWLAVWKIAATGVVFESWLGVSCQTWAAGFSPWEAIIEAARPYVQAEPAIGLLATSVNLFLLLAVVTTVLLNGVAVGMVRVWNPSRESRAATREEDTWRRESIWGAEHDAARPGAEGFASADQAGPADKVVRTRHVWDNPIIWREIRTWAYGRKILIVRLAYLVLFALSAASLYWMVESGSFAPKGGGAMALAALFLLSLVLVNEVTAWALTSTRSSSTASSAAPSTTPRR